MNGERTQARQRTTGAKDRRYQGEIDDSDAPPEATLKFEGRIGVADDDRGSDPYNHTGRFKRLVR